MCSRSDLPPRGDWTVLLPILVVPTTTESGEEEEPREFRRQGKEGHLEIPQRIRRRLILRPPGGGSREKGTTDAADLGEIWSRVESESGS